MARIFGDGAEFGDTLFWDTVGSTIIESTIKRSGNYSYKMGATDGIKNVTAVSEFYFRFAIYCSAFGGSTDFVVWRSGTTGLGRLSYNTGTNCIDVKRGTSVVGSGTIPLSTGQWYLVEVYVKINDTTGRFVTKIDGVIDVDFTGDTKPGANTSIDNITFSYIAASTYMDDFAFNDTSGSYNNSYPGDGHIVLLNPNGNGDLSQLVNSAGSSTNNYSYVDEIPPDGDTSYVESATSGQRDLYALTDFSVTSIILNVWAEGRARDTVAAGGQCNLVLKTHSTEYDSSAISLLTTYTQIVGTIHAVNPNTSAAWTDSELDDLQAGFKVV